MNANKKNLELQQRIERRTGRILPKAEVAALRRRALALHRWYELECGTDRGHVERDGQTGKPRFFPVWAGHNSAGFPIRDQESAALRWLADFSARTGLHVYVQGDPRGWPIYIGAEPLTDANYTNGVGVAG